MKCSSPILIALCAIIISLTVVNDSWGVDNQDIYDWFLGNPGEWEYTPPVNDGDFEEDIVFPPQYDNGWGYQVGDRHLPDGTYTLNLTAGRTFTFTGFLTIQETEYDEEETVGVGRIQVNGTADEMVTMEAAVAAWGGIVIETDPGNWIADFTNGNYVGYCDISELNNPAVTINDNSQAYVKGCHIDANGGDAIVANADEAVYRFHSNKIENCNFGIRCENPVDLEGDDLWDIIANNYIDNDGEPAISVTEDWNGWIVNNLIIDSDADGIPAAINCERCESAVIRNNTLYNGTTNTGIRVVGNDDEDDYCPDILNNIIVLFDIGVQGVLGANGPVDFCHFDDIPAGDEYDGGATEGEGCVEDSDPDFVSTIALSYDFHLMWTSPAVNMGDDEILDPDESFSDVGAFGGPRANQFEVYSGNYNDYCLIEDEKSSR